MSTATAEAPRDKATSDEASRTGDRAGRHEGLDPECDTEGDTTEETVEQEDRDAKRLRLSNVHHGHVLTHLRLLYKNTGEDGTVSRGELGELLELMEAAHSNPTPQPESGSVVHGTAGPGAPPDIHHTPFSHTERKRLPGQ
jgi:hypothetical protein